MELLILLGSFVIILAGAELFTNGIEWFGRKLGLAEGAVGSVLAAVGTALPETMIPIIAILFSTGEHSEEIGVGAILGAPFMLATLAMFVTGIAVMYQARKRPDGDVMPVDTRVLGQDMRSFAITYGIAIGAALFLPADADVAEDHRRDRPLRRLRLVRQGAFRGRPIGGRGGPCAAALPSIRPGRTVLQTAKPAPLACASSTSRCSLRWD